MACKALYTGSIPVSASLIALTSGNVPSGFPLAAVLRAGEDAADPPVRRIAYPSVVGAPVLDAGEIRRRGELASADAAVTVVDEHFVDGSVRHVLTLQLPVSLAPMADAIRVEPNAP